MGELSRSFENGLDLNFFLWKLEGKVLERTSQLEEAEFQPSLQTRKKFISANMSHETEPHEWHPGKSSN